MASVYLLGAILLRVVSPDTPHAAAISWVTVLIYGLLAQVVAVFSTIEIGPNLLAAITSLVGLATIIAQAFIATRVRHVDTKVERNRQKIKKVEDRVSETERDK